MGDHVPPLLLPSNLPTNSGAPNSLSISTAIRPSKSNGGLGGGGIRELGSLGMGLTNMDTHQNVPYTKVLGICLYLRLQNLPATLCTTAGRVVSVPDFSYRLPKFVPTPRLEEFVL